MTLEQTQKKDRRKPCQTLAQILEKCKQAKHQTNKCSLYQRALLTCTRNVNYGSSS